MSEQFSQFSYRLIKRVLVEKLGFQMKEVPGSHYVFTHPESDTLFPLPILPHQKNVALMNYRTIYNTLDKRGIMSKEAFQTLLKNELKKGDFDNHSNILEKNVEISKAA
jgi:predicted RNA binding protein YcfA (HicA-like mRNA interferase family)